MAALTPNQVFKLFSDGDADRVALYALRKVTTGDTIDLTNDFMVCKQAAVVAATAADSQAAACSGVSVTMPAGLANDAGYMIVWGASA